MTQMRTHTCGQLRLENAGEHVRIVGWMENIREVGNNFAFVIIRDFYGTTQVVVETEPMMKAFRGITKESTVAVSGIVRERASKNPKLPTGDIEIVPDSVEVLGRCHFNNLPFEINRSREADEAIRLKYRYLDLRNPAVKQNIILRCNVVAALRKAMTENGFLETHNADPHRFVPRGRAGLSGTRPQTPRQVLRSAAGAPAVQAAADDKRFRPLFPDRPLLPRRRCPR